MANWTWTGEGASDAWDVAGNWSNDASATGYPDENGRWSQSVTIDGGATIGLSGSIGAIGTLALGTGDISLSGTGTLSPNYLDIESGTTLELASGVVMTPNTAITMSGTGTAVISGGTLIDTGTVLSLAASQTLELSGDASVTLGTATGAGLLVMDGTDLSVLWGGPSVTIEFADVAACGTPNILRIATYSTGVTLTNLGYGDEIYAGGQCLSLVATGEGTAELELGTMVLGTVSLATGVTTSEFEMSGGYLVYDGPYNGSTQCFCAGVMIATPKGEVPVEALRAGDLVRIADGCAMAVRWIGQSRVATRFADPLRSLPIRIKAGALAEGVPARDLLVSPEHALFLQGVLVQAGALVNGTSILRETDVPAVFTYYHVELASHELLLADGAPAESFVDNVDRMNFHNWSEREAPEAAIREMAYPRAKSARQIPAALRRHIAARAARFALPLAA